MSQSPERQKLPDTDVLVLGAGLAGLTLTRHLLLHTQKSVVHLEKRDVIPSPRQKYGESSVQVAGYYYSRVLELEEYMYREQLIKYNLRFYWKTNGKPNETFEDFSQSYIRMMSNVASYQLNRNTFEGELLRRNQLLPERYDFHLSIADLDVQLSEDGGRHLVRWRVGEQHYECSARWVIDATGRGRFLAKKKELARESPVKHGSFFWWVEGQVDFEQLTGLSNKERRLHPRRQLTGHFPSWLATNHFCEEGLWFWVIPLQGKTSLGIVFDKAVIDHHDVFSVEKATQWVSEHFPLSPKISRNARCSTSAACSPTRTTACSASTRSAGAWWAKSGRFHDPLYSPGSDLISIHNTLLVDAILCDDDEDLVQKCQLSENLARAVYQAYPADLLPDLRLPRRPGGLRPQILLGAGDLLRLLRLPLHQRLPHRPPLRPGLPAHLHPPGADQPLGAEAALGVLPLEEGQRPPGQQPPDLHGLHGDHHPRQGREDLLQGGHQRRGSQAGDARAAGQPRGDGPFRRLPRGRGDARRAAHQDQPGLGSRRNGPSPRGWPAARTSPLGFLDADAHLVRRSSRRLAR